MEENIGWNTETSKQKKGQVMAAKDETISTSYYMKIT